MTCSGTPVLQPNGPRSPQEELGGHPCSALYPPRSISLLTRILGRLYYQESPIEYQARHLWPFGPPRSFSFEVCLPDGWLGACNH